MLFNSFMFLVGFLPAALLLVLIVQRFGSATANLLTVLVLSSVFYCYSSVGFYALLLGSVVANYLISGVVERRTFLVLGIGLNLLLLGVFKYSGFLTGELNRAGLPVAVVSFGLPLAISFYTFKQISFLADVASGRVARPTFLPYAAYVTFFPHLIAGPIVRYSEVAGRLARKLPFQVTSSGFRLGFMFVALGLAKKVLLADSFAKNADIGFSFLDRLSFIEAWVTILSFNFQIYFDFSGYSDIAIGLALMFGIRLPDNFRSPYRATSVTDFWRRWHMSLSRFLRDYLYIPLGGSRRGPGRVTVNLFVVMGLGGLWHGANWTFVVWGLLHGFYLAVDRLWSAYSPARLPRSVAWFITFMAVTVAWVFFRAPNMTLAWDLLRRLFAPDALVLPVRLQPLLGSLPYFSKAQFGSLLIGNLTEIVLLLVGFAIVLVMPTTKALAIAWRGRLPWAILCGALLGLSSIFLLERPNVFIYFAF